MATTYTSNLGLGKPALADRGWNTPINANADALDALAPIGALACTLAEVPSASLNVKVSAGTYQKADGTPGTYAGGTAALTASASNSIYLTNTGTLTVSTTGFPTTAHVRIATVTTGGTAVTAIVDARIAAMVVGTDALPYLPLAGGTMADGSNVALGTGTGTKLGTASTQKLGLWGATPVVQPAGAAQVALTDSTGGTASATLASIAAGGSYAQADLVAIKNAIASLAALTGSLRTALVAAGVIKGSA